MDKLPGAFGQAPESFDALVEETLHGLPARRTSTLRPGLKAVLLAAAILLLVAGTSIALTRGMGVLDFQSQNTQPPTPEATRMVMDLTGAPGVSSSQVTCTLRDAVLDGDRFMMTFEVRPKDTEKHLMIGFSEEGLTVPAGGEKSYLALAEEQDQTVLQLLAPQLMVNGESGHYQDSEYRYDAGVLVCYAEIAGINAIPGTPLDVLCRLFSYEVYEAVEMKAEEGWEDPPIYYREGTRQMSTLHFTVTPQQITQQTILLEGPFPGDTLGIDWISIRTSPIATYIRVQHQGSSAIRYRWVQGPDSTTDAYGYRSAMAYGVEGLTDIITESVWETVEALPSTLYLRPYDELEKQWGMSISLTIP